MPRKTTKTSPPPNQALAEAFSNQSGVDINQKLAKTETVIFRISKADKEGIMQTVKALKLSVTEYLTQLHYLASDKLNKRKEGD